MILNMGMVSRLSKRLQHEADVLREATRILKKAEKGERRKKKKAAKIKK